MAFPQSGSSGQHPICRDATRQHRLHLLLVAAVFSAARLQHVSVAASAPGHVER